MMNVHLADFFYLVVEPSSVTTILNHATLALALYCPSYRHLPPKIAQSLFTSSGLVDHG